MAVCSGGGISAEIILWAVRWYCRYGISYRELEDAHHLQHADQAGSNGISLRHKNQ
jgi:hypothetical protein